MLRRLLVTCLIVSILGYGMALAADVHGELDADDRVAALDTGADQDPHSDSGCGHCSHGIIHLLGLEASFVGLIAPRTEVLQCDHRSLLVSPSLRNLLRPPILG